MFEKILYIIIGMTADISTNQLKEGVPYEYLYTL